MHALLALSSLGAVYIPLHPLPPFHGHQPGAALGQQHKRKRAAERHMVLEEDQAVAKSEDITLPEEEVGCCVLCGLCCQHY
jgi:hypothetical protein